MKSVLKISVCVMFMFVTSAFAVFTPGSTATFDSLEGWHTTGDFQTGDGFAQLGKLGTNNDSKLWTSFEVSTTGQYVMSFDYKYTGIDNFTPGDDFALAGIGQGQTTQYTVFQADSSTGLTGQSDIGDWQTITSEPVTLEAGQEYWMGFELNESYLSRHNQLITFFDIDNVSLMQVRAVPAPGAVLLGAIGVGAVGWLRYRRAF